VVWEKVNVLFHGYGRANDCAQLNGHDQHATLKANVNARSTSPASMSSVCSQDILDPGKETMESGSASGRAHGHDGYGLWLTLEEHRKKPLSGPQRNCWSRKARAKLATSFMCSVPCATPASLSRMKESLFSSRWPSSIRIGEGSGSREFVNVVESSQLLSSSRVESSPACMGFMRRI
jgi:hypothetical protein